MKKAKKQPDEMRADYGDLDWSKAVRGKYYTRLTGKPLPPRKPAARRKTAGR